MEKLFRLAGSDVIVRLSPEDWVADRDPQLDKAIELLTEELGARKN